MNIVSRETILREKLQNVREGQLVIELLILGEEFGYEGCIDKFSLTVQQYIKELLRNREYYRSENLYTYIMNVCYVTELYLKGYYNKEHYMDYIEFLNIVNEGKTRQLLDNIREVYLLHINRLKKIILKSKKRIPKHNVLFENTRELLVELDWDLSICERYPITSANLCEFSFGRCYGSSGTNLVSKMVGFINFEKEVYSLYNELYIVSKMDTKYVNNVINQYIKNFGAYVPFNLFEKIIHNYLFGLAYSNDPETLEISKVDAELLVREIKIGTLTADELINQLIDKFGFDGYKLEFLNEYSQYLQTRINNLKDSNYFAELFLVTSQQ